MAIDSFTGYASVPTTLGTVVNLSGAGALGGLLGTGNLNSDDGDTSAVHIVNHIPADGVTVFDSFAYPIDAVAMPPGKPPIAVSFHFKAKVGTGSPTLNIGFGTITDSTTWGAGTATTAGYTVTGTSYALHEQPFDSLATDLTSLLTWPTDQAAINALVAGTASVLVESGTAAAHTATVNVSWLQVRVWYANSDPHFDAPPPGLRLGRRRRK